VAEAESVPRASGRVVVVEDDPLQAESLAFILRQEGYVVELAATGAEGLAVARSQPAPDTVLLDVALPDLSGVEVARRLRAGSNVPIIMLTARRNEIDKITGLDAGADDYVTKPFGIDELLARLRAMLRRATPATEPVIAIGELRIDLEKRAVYRNGELLQLTPHEFGLMRLLALNEGKLLTHRMILREVWGPAYQAESHYLHVYVSQLRRKIEGDPTRPRYLLTEPSAGYRLVSPEHHPVS
jgi:two-component system, OmpR family, KDP operon response regulator KdpE